MKQLFWWLGMGIKCIFLYQAEGCCLLWTCVVALLWLKTERPPKTGDFSGGAGLMCFFRAILKRVRIILNAGNWSVSAVSHPSSAKPPWGKGRLLSCWRRTNCAEPRDAPKQECATKHEQALQGWVQDGQGLERLPKHSSLQDEALRDLPPRPGDPTALSHLRTGTWPLPAILLSAAGLSYASGWELCDSFN